MKSVAHQYEDKLLEFAYGELPQHEAEAVDAHVRGCNRCAQSLSEIRGVRAAMARLPMEPAPDAGLESLLAYAEQAAKRNAEASKPAPSFFKRFMMPLASLAALVTVGVVSFRASQEFDTSPASMVADQKVAAVEEAARKKEEQRAVQEAEQKAAQKAAQKAEQDEAQQKEQLAQAEPPPAQPADMPAEPAKMPPVVAAAAPQPEIPATRNLDETRNRADGKDLAKAKPKPKDDEAYAEGSLPLADWGNVGVQRGRGDKGGGRGADKAGDKGGYEQSAGEVWRPEPKASSSKRAPKADPAPTPSDPDLRQQNYNDVGARVNKMQKQELAKSAPPPPAAPPPSQNKPSFGLGTSSPGALGGASTRDDLDDNAPTGLSQGTMKPSAAPPARAEDPKAAERQRAEREEREKWAVTREAEAKKVAEEDRRAAEEKRLAEPAPVAATPAPSAAPSSSSSSSYGPQKKSKSGFGITPQLGKERAAAESAMDEEMLQSTDSLSLNNDARFAENKRRQLVTQSVESARVASSSGDRMAEIQLLKRALQNGATGYEKAEALKRICDAYEALGEPESGDPFCDQLLREFPNTVAAKDVSERRKQVQRAAPAPKKPAAASERKAADFDDARPAEAAPAEAY